TALVVEGHRRFAVVEGVAGIPSAGDRTGGFVAALTEAGIEPELSIAADLTREGGLSLAAQVDEHLASAPAAEGPLCVFAPADATPTLTPIALPLADMARQAVEWVLGRPAADDEAPSAPDQELPHQIHVRGDVLLRESTALAART